MHKKAILIPLLFASVYALHGQPPPPGGNGITQVTTPPAGGCTAPQNLQFIYTGASTGQTWYCDGPAGVINGGTWKQSSGGGGGGAPTGPAGGDLSGTYPNPNVSHLSHVSDGSLANAGLTNPATTVNGQTCTLGAACTATAVPSGSAGGDLGSTYPNPTVTNLSHVTNGSLGNSGLANPATTVNGQTCTLGSTCTITGAGLSPSYTTVSFSATPTFTVGANTEPQEFQITLTGNVTSSTLTTTSATTGQTVSFKICQDGTGSRTFTWPANVVNPGSIPTTASTCGKQIFVYDGTNAVAFGPMVSDGATPGIQTPTGFLTLPTGSHTLVATGSTAGGDLSGTYVNPSVAGIEGVPFCTGYTPSNGQAVEYTTASSPNPCYTAATPGSSGALTQLGQAIVGGTSTGLCTVATTTITCTSIPGTYSELEFDFYGQDAGGSALDFASLQFNVDGTAAYQVVYIEANNSAATGHYTTGSPQAICNLTGNAAATAHYATTCNVRVQGYANTTFFKPFTIYSAAFGTAATANASAIYGGGQYLSLSAITSLQFIGNANLATGSVGTLYGKQ